jgi:integrase
MIVGGYLHHNRGKTQVRVRYRLWAKTQEYLKKLAPKSGRFFMTDNGTPLVHHSTLKKSGEPVRVDNVRNWFFRLCKDQEIEGFSFSNVRDTASTEVEKIDRTMTDLFLAHRDPRMAALYIDGEMSDTGPLDTVVEALEKRLAIWGPAKRRTPQLTR